MEARYWTQPPSTRRSQKSAEGESNAEEGISADEHELTAKQIKEKDRQRVAQNRKTKAALTAQMQALELAKQGVQLQATPLKGTG